MAAAAGHRACRVRVASRSAAGGAGPDRFPRRETATADRGLATGLPELPQAGRRHGSRIQGFGEAFAANRACDNALRDGRTVESKALGLSASRSRNASAAG